MPLFRAVACMLNQHQPVRRGVKWDGHTYIGVCRYCDTPIERRGRRRWRKRHAESANRGEPTPT